jgi:hypothetical protein
MTPAAALAPEFQYWVFLSYSHADEAWAAWLHRALESYRLPKRLAGRRTEFGSVPSRLFPVFRDREELSGSPDLGDRLRVALAAARTLVVLCSPRSAQSHWVNEEIKAFRALGRENWIFCVIVDGEPNATNPALRCFPPSLEAEPLACDARDGRDGKSDALLKLVAGIVGLNFDELKQRDRQRKVQRRVVASGVASTILAAAGTLSAYALNQRHVAESRTLAAASIRATGQHFDPVAGLEFAIQAADRGSTEEARSALAAALSSQDSLVILQHSAKVDEAAISPAASAILTCGDDAKARLWDSHTGQVDHEFTGHTHRIYTCEFSPDGSAVVTVSKDPEPLIWDARTGALIAKLRGHTGTVYSARFSNNSAWVVTASEDRSVRVWIAKNGEAKASFSIPDEEAQHAFFIANDSRILGVSQYGACTIWDLESGNKLKEFGEKMTWVNDAIVSPKGTRFMISNNQYRPYFYALPEATLIESIAVNHTYGGTFTEDDSRAVTGGSEGEVRVWDMEDGSVIKSLLHPNIVETMAISPDHATIVTGSDELRVWRMPELGGASKNKSAAFAATRAQHG